MAMTRNHHIAITPEPSKMVLIHNDRKQQRSVLLWQQWSLLPRDLKNSLHLQCNKLMCDNAGYPHLSPRPHMNYSSQHGYSIMCSVWHLGWCSSLAPCRDIRPFTLAHLHTHTQTTNIYTHTVNFICIYIAHKKKYKYSAHTYSRDTNACNLGIDKILTAKCGYFPNTHEHKTSVVLFAAL